jgi:alkylation response protein AidB-like acyl-CoA dehydrogenase
MDFAWNATQQSWHDRAVQFARSHLADPEARERDRQGGFWRQGWNHCAEFGAQGLPIPEAYGGQGQDPLTTIAAMEGLGYACNDNGLMFTLNASLWTVSLPILEFGTEDQKRRWLPSLCNGQWVGANAASEPESGSDIFSMTTQAVRDGDGWVLNGRKIWITGGSVADLLVVFATTNPAKGVLGVTCFVLPTTTPGFRVEREIPKMGMRTAPMGELVFENCRISGDALLGREGRGSRIFNAALEWERGAILAFALGAMRRQLEECVSFARKREQFGKAVGKFQSVSNRIVDMTVRLETSRMLVQKFAWKKTTGVKEATTEASMAKLHVTESFLANSLDAVRIYGAQGYIEDSLHERDLRDAIAGPIFSGTNDIQRNILAQQLRL